jgi:acetolactate synthase small subunit
MKPAVKAELQSELGEMTVKWLLALETENDPIVVCRLINVFRRKNIQIGTLALATEPQGLYIMAVVESREAEVDHIFHFLRRSEGISHVTCYRHESSANASYVFVDADARQPNTSRFMEKFPGAKLIFASQGRYLLEVPPEVQPGPHATDAEMPAFLPFACVHSTRSGVLAGVGRA